MSGKNLFLILFAIIFSVACTPKQPKTLILAYYVPQKNWSPSELPLDKLTHIIFSFTEVLDGEMKFKHEAYDEQLRQLVAEKKNYPQLKVMIACGGWGGCEGFSGMAATEEGRMKFVDSTIKFIEKYDLDGVDIDWEYPGLPGAGNPFMPEDKENFTALMRGLRVALDATGKQMVLTFASAGWQRYYEHIETAEVMKYADFMNVMTYDLAGGGSPFTSHHTNLGWIKTEDMEGTPYYESIKEREENLKEEGWKYETKSAEKIISYCMELGVKPEQLVIGGAFYGRAWKGVPPENNGLYQPNTGVFEGWMAYQNIREKYENKNGFVRYWDSLAKAPYLYNPTDSIFICYDDTASVKLKTRFAIDKKLGGIMFWQLTNDTQEPNSLLDAIHTEAMR